MTVNQDILRAVGLVGRYNKPMKILGAGELPTPLFVVADAFTASARAKIEAAGGSVNVLEVPKTRLAALGVVSETETDTAPAGVEPVAPKAGKAVVEKPAKAPKASKPKAEAVVAATTDTTETDVADTAATPADTAEADEPTPVDEAEPASGDDA